MENNSQLRWVKMADRLPLLDNKNRKIVFRFIGDIESVHTEMFGSFSMREHYAGKGKLDIEYRLGYPLNKIEWLEEYTQPLPEQKETPEAERKSIGIKKCADWLTYCLEIGFTKDQLDELESIWWKHKDGYGNLKK